MNHMGFEITSDNNLTKAVRNQLINSKRVTSTYNTQTKCFFRTAEVKILRNIRWYSLMDRKGDVEIGETYQVQDVVRWTRQGRREWNHHIRRMGRTKSSKLREVTNSTPKKSTKKWADSCITLCQKKPD